MKKKTFIVAAKRTRSTKKHENTNQTYRKQVMKERQKKERR